jgi:NPCBM/NEW2 domain
MNLLAVVFALAAPDQSPAPRFEIHSASDKLLVGNILQMDADGTLILQDGTKSPVKDLVSIRRLSEPLPAPPSSAYLALNNGDLIIGSRVALNESRLLIRADSVRRTGAENNDDSLRIPLTAAAYYWARSGDGLDRGRYALSLFAQTRANDQVLLRNGDVVSGTITGLDVRNGEGEIQIDNGKERSAIAVGKVVVIAFGNKLARARKAMGPFGHAVLVNGTRLSVTAPTIRDGVLSATTLYRDPLQIPLSSLAALDIYQGPADYLSDLKPAKYQYRSYQGEQFEWAADRNLEGHALALKTPIGVQTFDKGIAVHGECTLSYELAGQYTRFESVVGLDQRRGTRGSVELQALVDGKAQKIGNDKPLTVDNGPWRIKIDVAGAKELTLKVLWGDGGNVSDYVNWCDARLIRSAEKVGRK